MDASRDSSERRAPRLLREFDPLTIVLILAALAVSLASVLRVLEAPHASDFLSFAGFLAFAVLGAWLAGRPAFARELDDVLARMLRRLMLLGPGTAVVAAGVHAATIWPAAAASAERFPDVLSPSPLGTYGMTLLLTLLVDIASVLGGGLLGLVVILVPWVLVVRAGETGWILVPTGSVRLQRRIGVWFSLMLQLMFVVPTLIVFGADESTSSDFWEAGADLTILLQYPHLLPGYFGNIAWWLGVLLTPVGVLALVRVVRGQREATAASGPEAGADGRAAGGAGRSGA